MRFQRIVPCLAVLALVASACGEADDREVAAGDASTTTVLSEPSPGAQDGEWRAMAQPPASVAPGAPAVWTGSEIVVWGGGFGADGTHEAGGASYNPASDEWSELPEAPIDVAAEGTAVWTGKEVIFWGGAEPTRNVQRELVGSGAAYDPATRSWRRLPESPLAARSYHEAVWTGQEMIVWGGVTQCCPIDSVIHDPTAAAYDPDTDEWRQLADVPSPWSGDDGPAVSETFGGDMFVWRNGELGRFDVSENTWQGLGGGPAADPDSQGPMSFSTAGPVSIGAVVRDTFYIWTGGARAVDGLALGLPSGEGKSIAGSDHFTDFVPRVAAADDAIFGVNYDYDMYEPGEGTSVWRYDVAGDSWERLPDPPAEVGAGATPIWTGKELVVLPTTFGDDQQRGTGAIFARR